MPSIGKKVMQMAMSAFPGIDEAMSYAENMRSTKEINFSLIVFWTIVYKERLHHAKMKTLFYNGNYNY